MTSNGAFVTLLIRSEPGPTENSDIIEKKGEKTHPLKILGSIAWIEKSFSFGLVEDLTLSENHRLQVPLVYRWSIMVHFEAQEHVHTAFYSWTVDNIPVTFELDLVQDGRDDMILYWWAYNVLEEKIKARLPY
jgi:hypothetical protein